MVADKERVLRTPYGSYVGTVEESGVISFKGIPYAKPPVGQLRWQPPQLLDEGDVEFIVDKYPPAPIQPDMPLALAKRLGEAPHTPQSEDCLYINMWCWDLTTPKKSILFWVYGGSYTIGHASRLQERGERFVAENHDVVVVSCNYRLGVFGSFNLESIDPGSITLYGHSAGSNSICHHMAIPESAALFKRAICQSSFLVGHGTTTFEESDLAAQKILRRVGALTLNDARAVSAEQLLEAQIYYYGQAYTPPVCDGVTVFPDEFGRLARGEMRGKDLLIGNCTGEYDQLFTGLTYEQALDKAAKRVQTRLGNDARNIIESFVKLHCESPSLQAIATACNELGMTLGGEMQARACAPSNAVYKFLFAWEDPSIGGRAPHGEPCRFVFGNNVPSSSPGDFSAKVRRVWASFARSGNPGLADFPSWRPYGAFQRDTMVIDTPWSIEEDVWHDDYEFWRRYFSETECLVEEVRGDVFSD